MDAGKYTELITIQVRSLGEQNKNGFAKEEWINYYRNYAYANNLYGTEYYGAAMIQEQETVKLTLRWKQALEAVNTLDYRVLWRGRVYDIKSVDNTQYRNEKVVIKVMLHPQEEENV